MDAPPQRRDGVGPRSGAPPPCSPRRASSVRKKSLEGKAWASTSVFANNEFELGDLTRDLDESWKIREIWTKAYPMNGTLHAPVEALLRILNENGLSHDQVKHISATWHRFVNVLEKKDVHQVVSAQASLPFALAVACVRRKLTVDEFDETAIADPNVRALMERIEVEYDPTLYERAGRKTLPGRVQLETTDGRTFTHEVVFPKGHPENPLSLEELRAIFTVHTGGLLTTAQQDAIYEMVMTIEDLPDVAELMRLCVAS